MILVHIVLSSSPFTLSRYALKKSFMICISQRTVVNKWYHITLSLVTIAILSACSSSSRDDAPVLKVNQDNQDNREESVGICTWEQQSSTTNTVSVIINCYDKDGIDLYGETADAPHILLSSGKKIYLSSIKEANILYENNEIIGVRDYQLVADLKDNSEITAIAVMHSLNGNSLEYERVESDKFILRTDKAEVPTPTEKDTTAPILNSTTKTFTSTVWTGITLENVTATDNVDGSVTVVISGDTVDENRAWTYEVVYTATDEAGNETVIIHKYIIEAATIPNTAPTLNTVSVSWNTLIDHLNNNYSVAVDWDRDITFTANWTDEDWDSLSIVINWVQYTWVSETITLNLAKNEIKKFTIKEFDWKDYSNEILVQIRWR